MYRFRAVIREVRNAEREMRPERTSTARSKAFTL
jgi:hypothetical protein